MFNNILVDFIKKNSKQKIKKNTYPNIINNMINKPHQFSFNTIYSMIQSFFTDKKIFIKSTSFFYVKHYEVDSIVLLNDKVYIFINFINVLGLQGALPSYYQKEIKQSHSHGLSNIFSVFNHKFADIYYKINQKKSLKIDDLNIIDIALQSISGSLSGVLYNDHTTQRNTSNIKKFNAYEFFESNKNKQGLQRLISKSFNVFVEIQDLQPRKVDYSDNQFILGRHMFKEGILGNEITVYDQINIMISISLKRLIVFLPNHYSKSFNKIIDIAEEYLESIYSFRVFFKVRKSEIQSNAMLLGWTTFLKSNNNNDYYLISIHDLIYYQKMIDD